MSQYEMPPVELGEVVFWYPSRPSRQKNGGTNPEPHVAIVTRLGNDNLCLNITSPTNYNFFLRDGVRHVSDPRAKAEEIHDGGLWDYRPNRDVEKLKADVALLMDKLTKK